jgi:hypothetical protein
MFIIVIIINIVEVIVISFVVCGVSEERMNVCTHRGLVGS